MINRIKLMKMSWNLIENSIFTNIKDALRAAWKIMKIAAGIPTKIRYTKVETGEVRDAVALQVGSLSTIESGYIRYMEEINNVFQWRSFRINTIIF